MKQEIGKKTLLLIHTGSPDFLTIRALRRYLRQFLSDPRVMSMPWLVRQILLYGVILPFRPKKSLQAYKKIWTNQGSPLVQNTRQLAMDLSMQLAEYDVYWAARYGKPDIVDVLSEIQKKQAPEITVFPLFPQYASATVGSILQQVYQFMAKKKSMTPLRIVPPFYEHPLYIQAMVDNFFAFLKSKNISDQIWKKYHLLLTFHGLPVSQIQKADDSGMCFAKQDCCDNFKEHNIHCYRAQCYATAQSLADVLQVASWSVSFQSRLGSGQWLGPYTEEELKSLPQKGTKHLLVVAGSFVSDNLETLEELGIRGKEIFLANSGKEYFLIPQLNASPSWVQAIAAMVCNK